MKRANIALGVGPADYLDVGAKFAAINGKVNVGVILASGDDDCGGFSDFGLLEHLDSGGTTVHVVLLVTNAVGQLLDYRVPEPALGQGSRGGPANAPATDNDHVGFLSVINAKHLVVMLNHLLGTSQHEDGAFANPGVRAGTLIFTAIPNADHIGVGHLAEVTLGQSFANNRRAGDHGLGNE